MLPMFGYFTAPEQTEPVYDPGLEVNCPACNQRLSRPMVTPSLMVPGDSRSYFYRMHKACSDSITPEQESNIDGLLIDAIYKTREVN